jgi:cell division protein FtsI (penicillin-binding protein 3)
MMGGVVSLCMVALVLKASALMMLPDAQLESKANTQFNTSREIHGRRGDIRTIDGAILATSVEVHSLHADPSKLSEASARVLAHAIAPMLDLDIKSTEGRLNRRSRQDVKLGRNLVPDQVEAIMAKVATLTTNHPSLRYALFSRNEYRRFYPAGKDAAPLLGLGSGDNGREGLERALNRHLSGVTYKYVQWRDRKGRRITTDVPQARPGNSVILTINRGIQRIAEEALDNVMERSEPDSASVVIIDPETGAILALAQRPTHNPNDIRNINPDALRNRAVADVFEPGSVFKPFIAAAAIEDGIVTKDSLVNCENGRFRIGRSVIHDDHPQKTISVAEIIKFSSNIGSTKLAFSLGAEATLGYLKGFGFSRPTKLGIAGEAGGSMRSPKTIKPIELATTSYGHGVSATATQLASAVATLGNMGLRMEPYLISEIQDPSGVPIRVFEPTIDQQVISKKTAMDTLEMMVSVTEKGGTGTRAAIDGYTVAGKTGTAWKHVDGAYSSTQRIGSFIGVVPADAPRLAMAVVVDNPTKGSRFGGSTAGPAFAEIGERALRLMGVAPNPALMKPENPSKAQGKISTPIAPPELKWGSKGRLIAPDLSGLSMRDALVTLEGAGLAVRLTGSGRVVQQTPRPGHTLGPGDKFEVTLQ